MSATFNLGVDNNFLQLSQNNSIISGVVNSTNIYTTAVLGYNSLVTLTASIVPAAGYVGVWSGVFSFAATILPPSGFTNFSVLSGNSTPNTLYKATIVGIGGGISTSAIVNVFVNSPLVGFGISMVDSFSNPINSITIGRNTTSPPYPIIFYPTTNNAYTTNISITASMSDAITHFSMTLLNTLISSGFTQVAPGLTTIIVYADSGTPFNTYTMTIAATSTLITSDNQSLGIVVNTIANTTTSTQSMESQAYTSTLMPYVDASNISPYDIGSTGARWNNLYVSNGYAVNGFHTGDLGFDNGMKITEGDRVGLPLGLAFLNTKGSSIFFIDDEGNLYNGYSLKKLIEES